MVRRGARTVLVPNLSRPSSAKWSILRQSAPGRIKNTRRRHPNRVPEASLTRCAARSRSGGVLSSRTQRSRPKAATSSRRHHQGNNIVEDNDVFGDGVNVAARLEGLADRRSLIVAVGLIFEVGCAKERGPYQRILRLKIYDCSVRCRQD